MIGNLVLSLLASSFVVGVAFVGNAKADDLEPNIIENLIVAENNSLFMDYKVHNINVDFGFNTESITSGSVPLVSGLWSFGVNQADDVKSAYSNDVSQGIYNDYLCATSYTATRNGIPATGYTYVITFEFASIGESFSYNGQIFNIDGMELYPSVIADGVAVSDFTFSLSNNSLKSYASDDIVGQFCSRVVNADNDVNRFYSLSVVYKPSSGVSSFYFALFGNWCCNYGNDSNNAVAYANGYKVGYANGLSDGRSQSSGQFHGLFSAIADTPLRFLYGLFNFDLFGMSMLVVVLSLLTGLIVFGIVKKFWK